MNLRQAISSALSYRGLIGAKRTYKDNGYKVARIKGERIDLENGSDEAAGIFAHLEPLSPGVEPVRIPVADLLHLKGYQEKPKKARA